MKRNVNLKIQQDIPTFIVGTFLLFYFIYIFTFDQILYYFYLKITTTKFHITRLNCKAANMLCDSSIV